MSQNKNSCIHEGQNNAHVTNSITGYLTYHMRYYMNNYGEKKIGILAVFHSPSTSVFLCQFISPQSSILVQPTTDAALSTC
jgi:hypothetical protein